MQNASPSETIHPVRPHVEAALPHDKTRSKRQCAKSLWQSLVVLKETFNNVY